MAEPAEVGSRLVDVLLALDEAAGMLAASDGGGPAYQLICKARDDTRDLLRATDLNLVPADASMSRRLPGGRVMVRCRCNEPGS